MKVDTPVPKFFNIEFTKLWYFNVNILFLQFLHFDITLIILLSDTAVFCASLFSFMFQSNTYFKKVLYLL